MLTLLTPGVDYCLVSDWPNAGSGTGEQSKSGIVLRIGAVWPQVIHTHRGLLAVSHAPGYGNIKVVYSAGFTNIPPDWQLAEINAVAELRRSAAQGAPFQSESVAGDYSYQMASPEQIGKALWSVRSLLGTYQRWVW